MATAIARLPDAQLAPLQQAYHRSVAAKRNTTLVGLVLFVALVVVAGLVGEVDFGKLADNAWRFPNYIWNTVPVLRLSSLWSDLAEWYWGINRWLRLLGETLLIAYLGTLIGAAVAFVLCFLASANLVQSRLVVFATRRFLEFCRTVPELVFALIFVVAFGLGPLPGVLALAIHSTGALGKLFAEVVENIDMKPFDGVTATGATWTEAVRFAVVPQVLAGFASNSLLRFEINVRGAAIMGFVGAGGIGQDLVEAIRKFYYTDISAIVLLIIATVMLIDYGTERLRHRFIGMERGS